MKINHVRIVVKSQYRDSCISVLIVKNTIFAELAIIIQASHILIIMCSPNSENH